MSGLQHGCDARCSLVSSPKLKARTASDHFEFGGARHCLQNFLGHALGEKFHFRIAGEVVEGEDGQNDVAGSRKGAGCQGDCRRRPLQPVTHAGNGLDLERGRACKIGQIANLGDAAADGILAHNTAAPATFDQFVAGDDRASGAGQRHQHLHDAGLKRFVPGADVDFEARRRHAQTAQIEVRLLGQSIRPRGLHRIWAKIHRPVRQVGERSDIGQSCVLSAIRRPVPHRATSLIGPRNMSMNGNDAECIAGSPNRSPAGTAILGHAIAARKSALPSTRSQNRSRNGADGRRRSNEGEF